MNERIKELLLQAGGHFGDGLEFAVVFGELDDFKKFAELIIRECASICDSVAIQHDNNNEIKAGVGAWDCRRSIKQHFGVEE